MRDSGYRTREEIEGWKASDPIVALRTSLTDDEMVSAQELDALEAEIAAAIESANEAALASGEPDPATVLDHVVDAR